MRFSTQAVHSGQTPDPLTGAIIPPIYQTSTFAQQEPGVYKGYDYTRAGNPTFTAFEQAMAALEQAKHATVFSSGMGALTAIATLLKQGGKVVASDDLYGGTFRLFDKVFKNFGVELLLVDLQDLDAAAAALASGADMLIIESPTNPLLKVCDIKKLCALAKQYGARSIVDATFASPFFLQPLTLGADLSLHSTTKYIGGHSDVIGGIVATNDDALKEKMDFARKALGLNPSPFDVWLTHRGLKTLPLRMKQHEANAFAVARFLETHPQVKHVLYPGLKTHPLHEIARSQMEGFSGIVSVEFDLSLEQTKKLISSLHVFTLAESLGGVESLVDHPATMTHASIPKEQRERHGLTDGLVRFSIGIEDQADLIEDLTSGLHNVPV